ncbi:DUF7344 domain-containing protein [Halocatena pleomorpha]|uniref:DUF7344 domain-containing protein n=1 Tax=Halocatena pleomorpha TaxID=1785090 RepID=A0A3P3R3X6_9EURY|nr:hypothetical protein [Halocatena pleomorpha]RRJ27668.1 hypothetical protein EIK79_17370 [Halocatena pleomorpha]
MAVDSTSTTDTGRGLPEPVVEELLAEPYRRVVLRSLHATDGAITVRQLATRVVASERSIRPEAVSPRERERAQECLYEHHLPKLTATGVVRYNSRNASVELDDAAGQLLDRI